LEEVQYGADTDQHNQGTLDAADDSHHKELREVRDEEWDEHGCDEGIGPWERNAFDPRNAVIDKRE
jgi:hypothetical protein